MISCYVAVEVELI